MPEKHIFRILEEQTNNPPIVDLECDALFIELFRSTGPDARHVVIADQEGFHLRRGDPRIREGLHILQAAALQL